MAAAASVIRCDGISKRYTLGIRVAGRTLRDVIAGVATDPLRRRKGARKEYRPPFWALRDVSLEVEQGDILALIGRNGAGKSTLLKILARITEPTEGHARIQGRLGSLLEVGTGFHGELTGRENIYLNGAILGMRRREIDRRFEEIVDFSELEPFLDTPLKRYSTGMTVRLAFAVAAHLEPEILLVDEVLAVGDVGFQRKCIGKMSTVASEGRTVVFVSHNMAIIQSLCKRGILLEHGKVVTDAPIEEAVAAYLRTVESNASSELLDRTDRGGWNEVRLARVEAQGGDGEGRLVTGRPARFVFTVDRRSGFEDRRISLRFTLVNQLGNPIVTFASDEHGPGDIEAPTAHDTFTCDVPALPLVPGRYRVDVEVHGRSYLQDGIEGAAFVDVEQGILAGRPVAGDRAGDIVVEHRWTTPSLD
jgi:lipopolysaccharide transport system ATP-binding protein